MDSPSTSILSPLQRQTALSEDKPSPLCLDVGSTTKRANKDGAPFTSKSSLVPITPHRITAVLLLLTFILLKCIVASIKLEEASSALDCIFGIGALVLGWIGLIDSDVAYSSRWKWWFKTDYSGRAGWSIMFSAVFLSAVPLLLSVYHVLTTEESSDIDVGFKFVMSALTFGLCLAVTLPCIVSVLHIREQGQSQSNLGEIRPCYGNGNEVSK